MALQTSGAITWAQIQAEFGGANPIAINEYYKGGIYVPNTTANNAVPLSGAISASNFYGASAGAALTLTARTVLHTSFGGTARAGVHVRNDGILAEYKSTSGNETYISGEWLTGGVGANYEVMFQNVSGTAPTGTAALNTWLSLSSHRLIYVDRAVTDGTTTSVVRIHIRPTGGSFVFADFTLQANREPIGP